MVRMDIEEQSPENSSDANAGGQLSHLMDMHGQPLFNFLLVLTRDRELALDCLQETFTRAYESLGRGKGVNRSWLYTVARNRAIDEFRERHRVRTDHGYLEEMHMVHPVADSLVGRVMAALSEEEREILYLFIFDRFKSAEIASMLGIGGGAARMRIMRARERFRTLYGEFQ